MKFLTLAMLALLAHSNYSFASDYQAQTATEKSKELWEMISENPYKLTGELPDLNSGIGVGFIIKTLGTLSNLRPSFDHDQDVMPTGRAKIIHPFGVVGKIKWKKLDNQYTGIYQSGGIGLTRLSIAGDPTLLGNTFGMAVKVFVDNHPSVNLQVMYSLDGQGDNNNFFAHNFTNDIPEPSNVLLKPLAALFALVQNPPTYLPVDHFAQIDNQGKQVDDYNSPYSLIFKPSDEVKSKISSNSKVDFRESLMGLKRNTVLYEVWAKRVKSDRAPTHIANLVLDSSFTASEFGDQKLFFQHHH